MKITGIIVTMIMPMVMALSAFADTTNELQAWSAAANGLQARLTLVERREDGIHWLVPYLELRNIRKVSNQMEVRCDNKHLKIELVDVAGNPIHDGMSAGRSGIVPDLNTIILPYDSSIHISLECRNWGVGNNVAAVISTDSGAWFIQDDQRGKVFLRATLTGEEPDVRWKTWYGTLQTPPLKVDWHD
jgi:hypothetical protein